MRAILRATVVSGLVILTSLVIFHYSTGRLSSLVRESPAVGTSGSSGGLKTVRRTPADGATVSPVAVAADAGHVETDTAITATVKAKIAVDDFLKTRAIAVSTWNGVVTLTGRVESPAEDDRAVSYAHDVPGVTDVIDHIIIEPAR